MMNQHCTVIIPAYTTELYIRDCLNSVCSQTYEDFDILVVNDGSSDRTAEIVNSFIPKYPVSILDFKTHRNVTAATHDGIMAAQGPILTIVDSDDMLLPNSLKSVVPKFNDENLGFAWTNFVKSVGGAGWSRPLPKNMSLWKALMYANWWRASHQRFFRKSTYLKTIPLNSNIDRSSDYQLALLLALTGCSTEFVHETTYWYRMYRQGSLTLQGRCKQSNAVNTIKNWLKNEIKLRGITEPA